MTRFYIYIYIYFSVFLKLREKLRGCLVSKKQQRFLFSFLGFSGTHHKTQFGLRTLTQFSFLISKKLNLNMKNENAFSKFSFSQKNKYRGNSIYIVKMQRPHLTYVCISGKSNFFLFLIENNARHIYDIFYTNIVYSQ